ncbi:MAG: 3-deoxy-D-manno-octulosonic acid transferase [Deltaproteobacteria bacterium]|nr:3-deoxy-D-manno-octulosonic acid transferase [Deltaproteobacteria bacterium]
MNALTHAGAALSALALAPPLALACSLRPAWRTGMSERLGAHPARGRAIWIHGASVGEARVGARIARALAQRGEAAAASATTLAGRAQWRALAPDAVAGLAPLDHPWCAERALARVGPELLVLVETELWPSWIARAHARGVRVALVSARISERSFPRYRRARFLLARTLARIDAIGARSERDAERFAALGAEPSRVSVTGDLKLEPDPAPALIAPDLAARLGDVPLIVAGSTHAGEEEAALAALAATEAAGLRAALVLAPRDVARAGEVLALARGRRVRTRSAGEGAPLRAGEVLVLDTLGELAALWARADVAFVGGSLAPGPGGHNLLEPAQHGRLVLHGPHVANAREAAELLGACGGAERVLDAADLARAVVGALRDPARASARGAAGRAATLANRGALERTLALLDRVRGAA